MEFEAQEWFTVAAAARYLGMSRDYVRDQIREGALPVYLPNGKKRKGYRRGDLDALMLRIR